MSIALLTWAVFTGLTTVWTLLQGAEGAGGATAGGLYASSSSSMVGAAAAGPTSSSSSSSSSSSHRPFTSGRMSRRPMKSLNLWIDGEETERFVGMPMEIFVIQEGRVVSFLQEAYVAQHLPVLPPEVHVVKLTWQAPDDIYHYRFSDLRSLDPKTLYNPLISIPTTGIVPRDRRDFQVTIPCTRQETATASMYISLEIWNSHGHAIPGSPIKLHVRKRCIAYDERTICRFDCQNGGHCNSAGECQCRPGYLGQQCQIVACLPECQNNGTCVSPGKCLCQKGYLGEHCAIPICRRPCQHGGMCTSPDMCECRAGYYGQYCQHRTGICRIPCKNGGTCNKANVCICPEGYVGEFCQKPICRQSCGVHGRCVDVNQCQCIRGWRGRFCHKTVNRMSRDRSADKRRKKRRKAEHGNWQQRRDRRRQLRKREHRRQKERRKAA